MVFPEQRPGGIQGPRHVMPQDYRMNGERQFPAKNIMQQLTNPTPQTKAMISKGADGLAKTLTNVQKILKVVDTAAPIIKQYGPMIKNLPAMYKMMKALKDIESTDDETDNDKIEEADKDDKTETSKTEEKAEKIIEKQDDSGYSKPKLYI